MHNVPICHSFIKAIFNGNMHAYFWVLEIHLLKHVNKWGKLQLSTTKKMSAVEGWGHWLFHAHPENITLQAADTEWPYIPASVTVHSWLYTSQAPTILTIWNSNWGYNFLLFSWSLFREMIGNPFLGPTGLQLLFSVISGFLFTPQLYFCGLSRLLKDVLCVTGYDKNDISYFIYLGFCSYFLGLL